ncbi:MAG: oligosaccharide flippase family protein [Balneolaceae bacterium]
MKKLPEHAFWVGLSDGGAKLFGFLAALYLARHFGVESYGWLIIALSVLGIAAWCTDLGIRQVATRAVAKGRGAPADVLWLKSTLSVSLFLISSLVVWYIPIPMEAKWLIIFFLASLIPQAFLLDWYFHGREQYRWIALSRWLQGVIWLGGLLLFVQQQELLLVPGIYIASMAAAALPLLLAYRGGPPLLQKPNITSIKQIAGESVQIGTGSLSTHLVLLLPALLIGWYFSEYEAGLYGAAFKVIAAAMLFDRLFTTLLLPAVSKAWPERKEQMMTHLQHAATWMTAIGFLLAIALLFGAEWVIGFLFGDSYLDAVPLLQVVAFFLPATFYNSIGTFGLIAIGADRPFRRASLAGGAGALILMGAALFTGHLLWIAASVVAAELWIAFCLMSTFAKKSGIRTLRSFLMLSGACIASLLATFAWGPAWLMAWVFATVLFLLLAVATRTITGSHLAWLKERVGV